MSDSASVGFTHLTEIDWIVRSATFSIVIGVKGLGGEATAQTLRFAFMTLNLQRIGMRVMTGNTAARRLYNKIGFVEEGCLRRATCVNGTFSDVILMGALREHFTVDSGSR